MKIIIAFLSLIIFCTLSVHAQVVNIESQRMSTDTSGWAGHIKGSFSLERNVNRIVIFNIGTHLQYKTPNKKNLFLLLTKFSFLKTQKEEFGNTGFVHARYNYKINDWLRWEAFFQTQYNRITQIRHRELVGTGPRFKLSQYDDLRVYVGTLYMFEYEQLLDESVIEKNHRLSSYLSVSMFPRDNFSIISTTYIQPKLNDWRDYRIATENSMEVGITNRVSTETSFSLLFDTRVPVDVPRMTYTLETGFKFQF